MTFIQELRVRINDRDEGNYRYSNSELLIVSNDAIEEVNRDFGLSLPNLFDEEDDYIYSGRSFVKLKAHILIVEADISDPERFAQVNALDVSVDPRSASDRLQKTLNLMKKEYEIKIARFGIEHPGLYSGIVSGNLANYDESNNS